MLSDGSDRGMLLKRSNAPSGVREVPSWFYDEAVCGLTKAAYIWWANVLCMVFHLGLAFTTVVVATRNGKGLDTPRLTLYVTNLTWVPNSTNALVPTNQATEGLYLAHMTMWFFLLSALAHGLIVTFNFRQAWAERGGSARGITRMTGWYYEWIHECRQPLRCAPENVQMAAARARSCVSHTHDVLGRRWIEYSVSASLMGSKPHPPVRSPTHPLTGCGAVSRSHHRRGGRREPRVHGTFARLELSCPTHPPIGCRVLFVDSGCDDFHTAVVHHALRILHRDGLSTHEPWRPEANGVAHQRRAARAARGAGAFRQVSASGAARPRLCALPYGVVHTGPQLLLQRGQCGKRSAGVCLRHRRRTVCSIHWFRRDPAAQPVHGKRADVVLLGCASSAVMSARVAPIYGSVASRVAGEFSYLVLSLFSKGLLGMTLMFNVLIYDSFDEAMASA